MSLRVAAASLWVVALTASGAPRLSAELTADPTPGSESLYAYEYGPRVMFDGTHFVMTWVDYRSGSPAAYAAVLDVDGGVLQPGTHVMSNGDDFQYSGTLAGCRLGADLLWAQDALYNNNVTLLRTSPAPALTRLTRSFYPGDSAPRTPLLSCKAGAPLWVRTEFVYAPSDSEVVMHVVQLDGGLLAVDAGSGPLFVPRLRVPPELVGLALDFDGTRHLFAWTDGRVGFAGDAGAEDPSDIWGSFIDQAGGASPPFLIIGGPGAQAAPAVAFNGSSYVVAWTSAPTDGGPRDAWYRSVSVSGALGGPAPLTSGGDDTWAVRLVNDGVSVVAVWARLAAPRQSNVFARGVSSTATRQIASGWFDELEAAGGVGGRSLVTVRDFGNGIHAVAMPLLLGVPLLDGGSIDPARTVTAQVDPRLARVGGETALLWYQNHSVVGRTVDFSGFTRPVGTIPGSAQQVVGVASSGSQYFTTWAAMSGTLLTPALVNTSAPGFVFAPTLVRVMTNPVWDRDAFLVVQAESTTAPVNLLGYRVLPDAGTVPTGVLATSPVVPNALSLSANHHGTTLTLVDSYYRASASCRRELSDGGVTTSWLDFGAAEYGSSPRAATDGDGFLVTWLRLNAVPTPRTSLVGTFVGGDCSFDAGSPVFIGHVHNWDRLATSVDWDGKRYIVAYTGNGEPKGDVVITRVELDGSVGPELGVASDSTAEEFGAAVSASRPGEYLVAYSRFEPQESRSAPRVFARWVRDDTEGAPCASPGDCASGFCVDGVCCNSACVGGPSSCVLGCSVATGAVSEGVCTPKPAGVSCRVSTMTCDPEERCDGLSMVCPTDVTDAGCDPVDAGELSDAGDAGDAGGELPDAGVADAAVADAGVADAGVSDAAVADAGVADAGVADAGVADAGRWLQTLPEVTVQASCGMPLSAQVMVPSTGEADQSLGLERADGGAAAEGLALAADGTLTWVMSPNSEQVERVVLRAASASGEVLQPLSITIVCAPVGYSTGCGCDASGAAWFGLLALAVLRRRARWG